MKIAIYVLVLLFSALSFSQVTVKGTVKSDSIPLEFASVYVKHSTNGVATDDKGQFTLQAKQGDTLAVSYLGYKTKEFIVGNSEDLNIQLVTDSLDEVEIVGYLATIKESSIIRCGYTIRTVTEVITEDEPEVRLYPNPSSNGRFKLKLHEDYDDLKITVVNVSGQIVNAFNYQKFGEELTVDLSQCAQGIYIITIIADGERLNGIKAVRS